MIFWTNYPKCFLATVISAIGGTCGLLAVVTALELFSTEPLAAIAAGAVLIAGFFGFRKLADIVAERKYARMSSNNR